MDDAAVVRSLFIEVNRSLAPSALEAAFRAYVERCLTEEIDRIPDYYGERGGGSWVAIRDDAPPLAGMFGLEPAPPDGMELLRMYTHLSTRRAGIVTAMLSFADAGWAGWC